MRVIELGNSAVHLMPSRHPVWNCGGRNPFDTRANRNSVNGLGIGIIRHDSRIVQEPALDTALLQR